MIARKTGDYLYTFEKSTGMTGVFSGRELSLLEDYLATGKATPFIERLFTLGILKDETGCQEITAALQEQNTLGLEALHIELTDKCPLHCPQCYKKEQAGQDLPWEFLTKLIAEAQKLKLCQIAFGGGEPLVYPRLLQAVALVGHTQMAVSITSSGYGLTKHLLCELTKAGLNHMQISLNSLQEQINVLSRDGYQHALKALHLLSKEGLSFGINYVARADNLASFEELADYAADIGADNINILRYKPSNGEDYYTNALSDEQTQNLAHKIRRSRGVKIKVDSAYTQLLAYLHQSRLDSLRAGCGAGKTFLAVTPDGGFKPCSHLPLQQQAQGIEDYCLKSTQLALFNKVRQKLTGLCGACLYNSLCGGCRAVCLHTGGKLAAGEKNCIAFTRRDDKCLNIGKAMK